MSRVMFLEGYKAVEKVRRLRPTLVEAIMLMAIVVLEEREFGLHVVVLNFKPVYLNNYRKRSRRHNFIFSS